MKNLTKKVYAKFLMAIVAGLLASNAYAAGTAIGASATVKPRVNNPPGLGGAPLSMEAKGVKQFEVLNNTNGLVVDEAGIAPTAGSWVSIEVSTGPSDNSCFVIVADSAASTGLGIATTGRLLVPPIVAASSAVTIIEFKYPKQFHRGLAVVTSSPSSGSSCHATVGWRKNGGND